MDIATADTPITILCVDDQANILSSLRRLFRNTDYEVLLATSAAEGLELLQQQPVNLVISDMRMPEMDGAQFLEIVRERWPETIRILLTGYADVSSTIAAINRGEIYRYLCKPWEDHEVLLTVREALERQRLLQEKQQLELLTQEQNVHLHEMNNQLETLNASLEEKVKQRTAALTQTHTALQAAHEKLKQNFIVSIKMFSNMLELRGGHLAGHSRRVADLSRKLALHIKLPQAEVQDVMLAGLLHDMGKMGWSDELLNKPQNQLNGDQLAALHKHPLTGQNALMPLAPLHNVAKLIRSHHERFDGQGFPDGLSGMAIPMGARILALVNDYDGLLIGTTTGRRMKPEDARAQIALSRGKRYDPRMVDAFMEMLGTPHSAEDAALHTTQLKTGMVLAKDLVSPDGVLLLAADFTLTDDLIAQLREYESVEKTRLEIFVRAEKA